MSPKEPEKQMGLFWGYNVWVAKTFSDIFKNVSKNCLKVLIDKQQETYEEPLEYLIHNKLKENEEIDEILLFFGGDGIRHLFDNDELTKISFQKLVQRFDMKINPLTSQMGFKNIHLDEQISHYCHKFFSFN